MARGGKISLALLALLLLANSGAAGQQMQGVHGSDLTVSLLTFGVGDEVWEGFGHNGLRFRNARNGRDDVFHWGVFSFEQEGFVARFLRGEMLYSMGYLTWAETKRTYRHARRSIEEQVLDLTPEQREELWLLVLENARDPDYRYEYFLNNCSTRIRDLLNEVSDGALRRDLEQMPGQTYRFHTRRLTQDASRIFFGMDVLIGWRADRPISTWESAYIPMVLRDALEGLELPATADMPARPWSSETVVLYDAGRPADRTEPRFLPPTVALPAWTLTLTLVVCLGAVARGSRLARTVAGVLAFALAGIVGLQGVVSLFLCFTAHRWAHWNENLLQFTPLTLVAAPLLLAALQLSRRIRLAERLTAVGLLLSVVGFMLQALPGIDQINGAQIAVALPIHAALWLAARAPEPLVRRDPGLESELAP